LGDRIRTFSATACEQIKAVEKPMKKRFSMVFIRGRQAGASPFNCVGDEFGKNPGSGGETIECWI
jgi:hypothetical protein